MKLKRIANNDTIKRFVIVVMLLIWVGGSFNWVSAKASSATLTFSTTTPQVKKGETFSVVLTISSAATVGDFEAYIFYDPDIMEFKSGGSFISGGDGLLRISDLNTETADTTKKYSMKFKAIDVGACEVGISDTAIAYDYDEGSEMSLSSDRLSIAVVSTEKLSKNNDLATLKISPSTLKPEFDPKVTSYTTEVPANTDKLFVSGVPADTDATVTIKGDDKLKVGDNFVVITVKAPSGDKKEYEILVKMLEGSIIPESSGSPEPTDENGTEEGFAVFIKDGNTFIKNTYQYQIMDLLEDSEIPIGYEKTTLILNGVSINAYTLKNDLENDFLLMYVMNQDGELGFYQYDRVENTLQRSEISSLNNSVNDTDHVLSEDKYNSNLKKLSVVIAVLAGAVILLLILVIRSYFKLKGYHDDDLD